MGSSDKKVKKKVKVSDWVSPVDFLTVTFSTILVKGHEVGFFKAVYNKKGM